jgi:regulator of replication initiation timing
MSEKKRTLADQADEIRRELDDLIGDDEFLDVEQDPEETGIVRQPTSLPAVNYSELKSSATKKAKKTIDSLMRFYLDAEIIEKDEYIQAKKKMDEMTMSSLIYQLQAGERALTTLLETIESGELAPRMFEVLATLQKSMLDIIKSQTMYLMAAEESTKRIARDIEIYKKREDTREIEQAGGDAGSKNVQRGTKDLMAAIQAGLKNQNTEEIQDIEIDETEE